MAYRMVANPMTLSGRQGHSSAVRLSNGIFRTVVQQLISADMACCAIPLRQLSFLLKYGARRAMSQS